VFHPKKIIPSAEGIFRVLYIGRIHPEKGIELLIKAFKVFSTMNSQSELIVIGPSKVAQGGGGEAYRDLLIKESASFNIRLLDPIFDSKILADAYRSADVFCYPSLAEKGETFGLAVLEAMACGITPVVSSLACFSDFVEDGETGFIFDHQSQHPEYSLAEKLQYIFSNQSIQWETRRKAAIKANEFSLETIAQHYLTLFGDTQNYSNK